MDAKKEAKVANVDGRGEVRKEVQLENVDGRGAQTEARPECAGGALGINS